mmetsp:Transcript_13100/g.27822  ORF Transcript_13100/g.27822 Transcript_13100/m.27822 type:complete len:92 (+) Transcript_13100:357-632(+)
MSSQMPYHLTTTIYYILGVDASVQWGNAPTYSPRLPIAAPTPAAPQQPTVRAHCPLTARLCACKGDFGPMSSKEKKLNNYHAKIRQMDLTG